MMVIKSEPPSGAAQMAGNTKNKAGATAANSGKPPEVLSLGDARTQNLIGEILADLEKRVPQLIRQDEYDTIKTLCSNVVTPCDSKHSFLLTVLNEASASQEAVVSAHPTWQRFQYYLHRILEPIDRFSAALDILSQAAGTTGLLIWGSIRIVIQVRTFQWVEPGYKIALR
jgi:hypothetical protein